LKISPLTFYNRDTRPLAKGVSEKAIMSFTDFIATTPLFAGLLREHLLELSKIAVQSRFRRGQMIFSEGSEARGFYILRSGRVKVFKLSSEGKEQILHILTPKEPFGEVAVFAGMNFPAYAEAMEESEVVFFPKPAFESLIRKDPSMALNMLAVLSTRLKHFTRLVEDLSLKEVPQRLAAYLLFLGDRKGKDPNRDVDLDITKGQLASLLGTIPETLSRILGKMTSQGYIRVEGRKIRILDEEALGGLSSGDRLLM
jgi:CRP/FNR family transcriptional regulator, dissimilatory nitrate respiration regulator